MSFRLAQVGTELAYCDGCKAEVKGRTYEIMTYHKLSTLWEKFGSTLNGTQGLTHSSVFRDHS